MGKSGQKSIDTSDFHVHSVVNNKCFMDFMCFPVFIKTYMYTSNENFEMASYSRCRRFVRHF